MENLLSRYRNVSILVGVLFLEILGLAVQVKRKTETGTTRLVRVWAVGAVTPLEKAVVWSKLGSSNVWRNYAYLRGVRQENRELKEEIEKLHMEQVRMKEDAEQAHRLQALLGFKEQFISHTVAAQVIGTSGTEHSRIVYIDKGADDGVRQDLPVITADGIVGKVLKVFGSTSQVLLINDQTSGAGAILEKSRIQGVLHGTVFGEVTLDKVMSDETVQPGETVLTSGGDQIFPKGLRVGTVAEVRKGKDSFLNIRVKPTANLAKLEEVLIITEREERVPEVADTGAVRAVDVLAERLPSVPQKPAEDAKKTPESAAVVAPPSQGPASAAAATTAPPSTVVPNAPDKTNPVAQPKPPEKKVPENRSNGAATVPPVSKPAPSAAQAGGLRSLPAATQPSGTKITDLPEGKRPAVQTNRPGEAPQ